MEKIKDGGFAFGGAWDEVLFHVEGKVDPVKIERRSPGMSLRDWFAGQVLIGLVTRESWTEVETYSKDAEMAYDLADAMIAERKKEASHDRKD